LGISTLIALGAVALVYLVWYPAPLHNAVGVTGIFLLIITVDIFIGPVLSFVVYKPGKKTLKMDLAIIALLQIGALGYGLHTVEEGRPVWLVFSADRFDLVRALDLDTRYADTVKPEYRSPSLTGPRWVAALPPEDDDARSTITLEAVFAGLDLQHRPYLYHPLTDATETMRARALPLSKLYELNPPERVRTILERWPDADAWLPLSAPTESMVVLINRQTAKVVAVADLAPWL
jgi:hypothetical protein